MLLTARVLRMLLLPSAGSSLTHSLCGQSVIQKLSTHAQPDTHTLTADTTPSLDTVRQHM